MKAAARQSGFTLVELLVASVIMLLILSALGNLFIGTNRAYRKNDQVSERQQSVDAAGQLLGYEIGLAGFRGSKSGELTSNTFTTPILLGTLTVPAKTLIIEKGTTASAPDKITVRYYESRYPDTAISTVTQFSIGQDSNSAYNLYRQSATPSASDATRQPAIANVKNLKVLKYIKKDGNEANSATADTLAALKLELTFTDPPFTDPQAAFCKETPEPTCTKQVVISLPNPQTNPELPTLLTP